jgi:uncharacterized protein
MKNKGYFVALSLLMIVLLVWMGGCYSPALAALSKPAGYVTDYAEIIPFKTAEYLEILSQELENKTGTEIAIVTIRDLGGQKLETYAVDLFREWGIGKNSKDKWGLIEDNGVLILVAGADRKIHLEVGYGMKGIISKGQATQILQERWVTMGVVCEKEL